MLSGVVKIEIIKGNKEILEISTSLNNYEDINIIEKNIGDETYRIYYLEKVSDIKVYINEDNIVIELIENKSYIFNIKKYDIISQNWLDTFIQIIDENKNNILGIFNSRNYIGEVLLNYININYSLISVKSTKIDYYNDFWGIIEELNNFHNELVLQVDSYFQENYVKDGLVEYEGISYSKIAYLLSILENKIPLWVESIKKNPKTELIEEEEFTNIWQTYDLDMDSLTFINEAETIKYKIGNKFFRVPIEVIQKNYVDTIDTQENYFVKFFLEYIKTILNGVNKQNSLVLWNKCQEGVKKINIMLNNDFFQNISPKKYIYFNSQVLQKRYPYNKIFEAYNKIDLLTRLNTNMFDDFIKLGQKNVPLLYEYWTFIKIFEVMKSNFYLKENINCFYKEDNELNVEFRKNGSINVKFTNEKEIDIILYYNKMYKNNTRKESRSYSHNMQPDISLEFYYKSELKGIIHFDSKYKLKYDMSSKEEDINKMHTYNDAILKTVASFIVYPGNVNERYYKNKDLSKFPCVGAIPLTINEEKNSIQEIEKIIYEYINDLKKKM